MRTLIFLALFGTFFVGCASRMTQTSTAQSSDDRTVIKGRDVAQADQVTLQRHPRSFGNTNGWYTFTDGGGSVECLVHAGRHTASNIYKGVQIQCWRNNSGPVHATVERERVGSVTYINPKRGNRTIELPIEKRKYGMGVCYELSVGSYALAMDCVPSMVE